jgi:hypothetical protein
MRRRWAAAGLATAAIVASAAAPAVAQSRTFHDARGDVTASVDIQRVRVVNGSATKHAVRIFVTQRDLRPGDRTTVWLDTKPRNRGPEYRADGKANTNDLGLVRVNTWKDPGKVVKAPRFVMHSDGNAPGDRTRFFIPRHAIGDPGAIRVSARAQRHGPQGVVRDWAPSAHTFYGWVSPTR